MNTILVVLFFLCVGLYEGIPLVQKGEWKIVLVYTGLMFCSLTISILVSLGVKIPSPVGPIEDLVQQAIHMLS